MLITASAINPPVLGDSWEERQEGPDAGLISAWLAGRDQREWWQDTVAAIKRNELPVLPFKGGIPEKDDDEEEAVKKQGKKLGSLHYIAMMQGLLGEDLYLETSKDIVRVCSKTGVQVIFTCDTARLLRMKS